MTTLLWLDLETTGLDPAKDHILEVAAHLAPLETPFAKPGDGLVAAHYVLRAFPDRWRVPERTTVFAEDRPVVLAPFVLEMHTKNGLLRECPNSVVGLRDAEEGLLHLVSAAPPGDVVLAGFSVHFDLGFLRSRMPELAKRLSHKLYDVSAVKLFARSLGMPELPKGEAHRAVADIQESVDQAVLCAAWLLRAGVPLHDKLDKLV